MNVSLGVYGFVVSLVLAAAIAGGAVYISNLKRDLNVCKVCRVWIKLAQLSKDAQLIKDENRRWTAGLVLLGILNSLCPKKKVWLKCVSLLLGDIIRHHCYGLIYRSTCMILINVYSVRMAYITELRYTIYICIQKQKMKR